MNKPLSDSANTSLRSKALTVVTTWGPFFLYLLWFWRPPSLFTHVPGYGDILEIIWGIEWYGEALRTVTSPFNYPYFFAPLGFETGTLAHTALYFLLAQPFALLGGSIFAFHMMAFVGFVVSYAGSLRFFASKNRATTIAAALVYTFIFTRAVRSNVHHNLWLMTSILPWLGWQVDLYLKTHQRRHAIFIGLLWGLINCFSLYGIFFVPILLLPLVGKSLFSRPRIRDLLIIGALALTVSLPTLIPYIIGSRLAGLEPTSFPVIVQASSNLSCLLTDPIGHPLEPLRNLIRSVCKQPPDWIPFHLGTVTVLLFLVGVVVLRRGQSDGARRWMLPTLCAVILSFGPLALNNEASLFSWRDNGLVVSLWNLGYAVKPEMFLFQNMPPEYKDALPLPAFLLLALVPFFEGARQMGRYAFLALLSGSRVAAAAADALPRGLRYPLLLCWCLLALPPIMRGAPLDRELSAAHTWLDAQPEGEGYVDIRPNSAYLGGTANPTGDVLWASWLMRRPAASFVGSFRPKHTALLYDEIQHMLPQRRTALMYDAFGVEHVLIHNGRDSKLLEDYAASGDYFEPVDCFDGKAGTVWTEPICVVSVKPLASNVRFDFGWSVEPWGAWAIDRGPHAEFMLAAPQPVTLSLEAFPFCLPGQQQTLEVIVNTVSVQETTFTSDCETQQMTVNIPAEQTVFGWNSLDFRLGYAVQPSVVDPANSDPRTLAIGFNYIRIDR